MISKISGIGLFVFFLFRPVAKTLSVAVLAFLFGIWIIWTLRQIKDFERTNSNTFKKQPQHLRTHASNTYFTIIFYAKPAWFNPKTVVFDKCSFKNCELTIDKQLFSTSAAVIFHHDSFSTLPEKPSGQVWIFATLESPFYTSKSFNTDRSKMQFNWTMSYRKDAEGFSPYAFLRKQLHIPVKNYTSIFINKTNNIAWVVSHCQTQSKREAYVRELSKYIDVDIYGKCGKPCPFKEDCKIHLSKIYRFYLSFENSLCKDYVTEKILSMYIDGIDFIPIVRGAPNAGDILPHKTYISTSDFKSPQKLAAFLKMIGSDESRYISYLKEKEKYLNNGNGMLKAGICDICYHLNVRKQKPKIIDINKWLWENQCHLPNDIPSEK